MFVDEICGLIIDCKTTEKLGEPMQLGMSHALGAMVNNPSKTPLVGGIIWFAGVLILKGLPSSEQLLQEDGRGSAAYESSILTKC